jgi:hypothetical protein
MVLAWRRQLAQATTLPGWLLLFLASLPVLVVYSLTLAPDLTQAYHSADGAELITAAVTLGIPHPPGYPTYIILGHVASRIPVGTLPLRFNLFSALAMGAAATIAIAAASHVPGSGAKNRAGGALAAGLTLAFLAPVWQQAVVTEVYGLNLVVVSLLILALLRQWPAPATGFLFGLSLTTHLTSLLLAPFVLGLAPRRQWPRLGAATLLGLAPLLILPILALHSSPVVWGEPQSPGGWWWLLSGQLYRPNLLALPAREAVARLWDWLWAAQLFVPAAALLAGLPTLRRSESWRSPRQAHLLAATSVLFLLTSLTYRTEDAIVLLLPGLLCAVLLLAPVLARVGPASLLLPALLLLLNFNRLDLSADRELRSLAEQLLSAAPQDAILLTEGDATTFSLWYLHEVEGQRPDILVVDRNLFGFEWYRHRLAARHRWLPRIATYDLNELGLLGRPLCYVRLEPGSAQTDC